MSQQKVRSRYKKQLAKVKQMLEEFLQPWVIKCIEPGEVLNIGWIFLGESDEEVNRLERLWDEYIESKESM